MLHLRKLNEYFKMKNTRILRHELNTLLKTIATLRVRANSTTSGKLWSRLMHRLKALRKSLKGVCRQLKELLYSERGYFEIDGKIQSCLIMERRAKPYFTVDVKSLVDGHYYRVPMGTNKGYILD